jgi:thymidylate synthase (FAD)
MRHRTWKFNEISRRYTEENITFYNPTNFRTQHVSDRQASNRDESNPEIIHSHTLYPVVKASTLQRKHSEYSLQVYEDMINNGVCREQARGVLPQNMMTTYWATVDLSNLIKFLALRDDDHAQWEIAVYAKAIKRLITPYLPNIAEYLGWSGA